MFVIDNLRACCHGQARPNNDTDMVNGMGSVYQFGIILGGLVSSIRSFIHSKFIVNTCH